MNIHDLESDWRYTGQDKYLFGVQLEKQNFNSSIRDHDHCEFCFDTFSEAPEDLHEGYCTRDKYHWICKDCFDDFKEKFSWEVINVNDKKEVRL